MAAPVPQQDIVRKPSTRNRRATVRYRCAPATPGRIFVSEDLEFQRAWLLNLSTGGIGLQLARSLDVGFLLTIQIRSQVSKKLYELPAQVAHSEEQSGGEWSIGCEFLTPLTIEELDDLLG